MTKVKEYKVVLKNGVTFPVFAEGIKETGGVMSIVEFIGMKTELVISQDEIAAVVENETIPVC